MHKKRNILLFFFVLFSGLAIRLIIAWFALSPLDTDSFYHVFAEMKKGNGMYSTNWLYFNNPPILGWLIPFLGVLAQKSGIWLSFWAKIPFIISDLLIFFLLYLYASWRKCSEAEKILYPSLYWLNPFVITVSAYQGQLESLFLLPLALSVVFLGNGRLNIKNIIVGGLLFGLSCTVKIIPLMVLPAFFIFVIKKFKHIKISLITNFSIFVITAFLPLTIVFLLFFNQLQYVFLRIFAYAPPVWGFWGLNSLIQVINYQIHLPQSFTTIFIYNHILSLILAVYLGIFLIWIKKADLLLSVLIIFSSVYLLSSSFSVHYLMWIIPFWIMLYIEGRLIQQLSFYAYSSLAFILEMTWFIFFLTNQKHMAFILEGIIEKDKIFVPEYINLIAGFVNLPVLYFLSFCVWLTTVYVFYILLFKTVSIKKKYVLPHVRILPKRESLPQTKSS